MKASVIVLSWNGMEYLEDCLDAVLAQEYPDFEVIVVDNGSSDGSADFVERLYPQVRLIRNERNLGFAAGNNVGLRAARGDALVLLNQDAVVEPGWLEVLVTALEDPTIGMVGCKLLYPDGTIQHAGGRIVDSRGSSRHIGRGEPDTGQYDTMEEVDFVTGAALALSRDTLARVGPLDEGFAPAYYEDTDWSYRVREVGLRVVYCPTAVATHFESTSLEVGGYSHHVAFNYGRLRFLLKHSPMDWLWDQFAPAEASGIRAMSRGNELMAVRQACLRVLFDLPEVARYRADAEGVVDEWNSLLSLVIDLRAACVQAGAQRSLTEEIDRIRKRAVGPQVLEAARHRQECSETEKMNAGRVPGTATDTPGTRAQMLQEGCYAWEPELMQRPGMVPAIRRFFYRALVPGPVRSVVERQPRFNRAVIDQVTTMLTTQTEMRVRQNEIAVTQVAILNLVSELLVRLTGTDGDAAQSTREITTLAEALARLDHTLRAEGIDLFRL